MGGAHGEREGGRGGETEGGEGREGRDGKRGEGVPECPNPELASLFVGDDDLTGALHIM